MRILLGVTGGIAAYKTIDLCNQLTKQGHEVRVCLTDHAQHFVTPLAYETLSKFPVVTGMFDGTSQPVDHINLAKWADRVLIAPATANFIAKMALGLADDFLSTLCLAYDRPIHIAPAMNVHMYEHPATQANLRTLQNRGHAILEPDAGFLACGDIGKGRMMDPVDIAAQVVDGVGSGPLAGKKVVVTAGPTRESMDPVRFVSNYSSGKMGYAIARQALSRGAEVILVSGPVDLDPVPGAHMVYVESTLDLQAAVDEVFADCDGLIMAAAPADYRPLQKAEQKIKKSGELLTMQFTRNPDILRSLGKRKTDQVLIGFAAESQDLAENAQAKLAKKNLDYIIANDITADNAGFGKDVNTVHIFSKDGADRLLPTMSKEDVADIICDLLWQAFESKGVDAYE